MASLTPENVLWLNCQKINSSSPTRFLFVCFGNARIGNSFIEQGLATLPMSWFFTSTLTIILLIPVNQRRTSKRFPRSKKISIRDGTLPIKFSICLSSVSFGGTTVDRNPQPHPSELFHQNGRKSDYRKLKPRSCLTESFYCPGWCSPDGWSGTTTTLLRFLSWSSQNQPTGSRFVYISQLFVAAIQHLARIVSAHRFCRHPRSSASEDGRADSSKERQSITSQEEICLPTSPLRKPPCFSNRSSTPSKTIQSNYPPKVRSVNITIGLSFHSVVLFTWHPRGTSL